MIDPQFLDSAMAAAAASGHIWPEFAACEAALESRNGKSTLAREDNNLFGMKQHVHPVYGTAVLPTEEFLGGEWKRVSADWVKYPALADCFRDRMDSLRRLSTATKYGELEYPHYAAALAAPDGPTFIREVSKTWSTDPSRAQKVLEIYREWKASETA
jgi:flagellum-specific peptidoglycan hydrolase FlgJ